MEVPQTKQEEEMFWWNRKKALNPDAVKVFEIAKDMGDAVSAIDITRTHSLPLSEDECQNLINAVYARNADPSVKAKQLLAIVEPWAQARAKPVEISFVNEVLKMEPSLLPAIAANQGIHPVLRLELIEQMLRNEKTAPRSIYLAFRLLPGELRAQIGLRAIEYALKNGEPKLAYYIARCTRFFFVLPLPLRERIARELLALAGSIAEREKYQRYAVDIV